MINELFEIKKDGKYLLKATKIAKELGVSKSTVHRARRLLDDRYDKVYAFNELQKLYKQGKIFIKVD